MSQVSIDEVAADDDVKAIVIFCTGRTFIAGADIREFGRPAGATLPAGRRRPDRGIG